MLSRDEAVEAAAGELALDAHLLGVEVGPGRGVETPHFWVFYPDSVEAMESSLSRDSWASRLPPIVVDRRTGRVTRPVAAGRRVTAEDLGPGEWFVVAPGPARAHDPVAGLGLSAEEVELLHRLRHFRLRRAARDSGDTLEASVTALEPDALDPGLREAGLRPSTYGWETAEGGSVRVRLDTQRATAHLSVSGNGPGGSPWTITGHDIALAARLETALAEAPWIRSWV
ncbi:hypothetical protein ACEXQD_04490 [Herbiconiux sp. P15]|uniref:hypothetical protein n=1 Tax=Herbiconiux liukaitaii TaxID=3342799 RepID=UPI0035B7238E